MTEQQITTTPGAAPAPAAEAWLSVSARLGEIGQQLAQQTAVARAQQVQPIRGPLQATGAVPSSGPLVLDLGAPAMGRRWVVKNLSITDAHDVTAAVTGKAWLYAGQVGAYGPHDLRWMEATLPAVDRFGSDQLAIIPPDRLLVVITGGTAAQVLLARAEVLDFPLTLPEAVMPL